MDPDQELLERNAHIPSDEIRRDIFDTENEIDTLRREVEHLQATPISLPSARLDHIRADARRDGIRERQEFIAKLKRILELREGRQQ